MKRNFFVRFVNFIGKTAVFWAVVATVSAILLILTEMAIAGAIQLLLVTLGATLDTSSLPSFMKDIPSDTISVGIFLVVVAGLRAILQVTQGHGNFMIRESVLYRLRISLLDGILGVNGSFVRSADVQTNLAEIFPKASNCAYYIVNTTISLVQTIGLCAALFWLSAKDAAIAIIGVVVVGVATRYSSKTLRKLAAAMPAAQMRLNEGLQRIARNWLFVKIMRAEDLEYSRLRAEIDQYNEASVKGVFWTNANGAIAPFLGVILIVLIVHCSQHVWHTPGVAMLSFLYMLVRFIGSLTQAVSAYSAVNLSLHPLHIVMNAYNVDHLRIEKSKKALQTGDLTKALPSRSISLPPTIELKKVCVRFEGNKNPILDDLSLRMQGGSQLGILGPSGSGKTTILNVILGILEPNRGEALIGGLDATKVFAEGLVNVGYVGPDPLLIEGTVAQNLRYGQRREISDNELWDALNAAQLSERIREFPLNLRQPLNEHADILSAGQKQRLSLARALVSKPDILILDEASANLDEVTEREIAKSIASLRGKCTIVIVSHRKGILSFVDEILEVNSNKTVRDNI